MTTAKEIARVFKDSTVYGLGSLLPRAAAIIPGGASTGSKRPEALYGPGAEGPTLVGIPVDFILFAGTLLGVALFHHHVLQVALTGLATIATYKILFTGFKAGAGVAGFGLHMAHEWVLLVNLLCLLVGFGDEFCPDRQFVLRKTHRFLRCFCHNRYGRQYYRWSGRKPAWLRRDG